MCDQQQQINCVISLDHYDAATMNAINGIKVKLRSKLVDCESFSKILNSLKLL